ncbi:MAG: hypothetical protein ACT4P4_01810 [Betaproteobacteria bacterium]
MSDREMYASTICGLIDFFGGFEVVARILNVTVAELESWADGRVRPPTECFLRLIDMRNDMRG